MKYIQIFSTIFIQVFLISNFCSATSCGGTDPKHPAKPDPTLKSLYDRSSLIGVFKVESLGQELMAPVVGRRIIPIVLKPIQVLKGEAKNNLAFEHMAINNHQPDEYKVSEKYLIVFSRPVTDGKINDGICGGSFRIPLKDATEYLTKLQKQKELNHN